MNNIEHFDKFTAQAKKAVRLAQEEARLLQHDVVGTEHLLLGLVREGESVAAHVLELQGVTLERLRRAVEDVKGRGNNPVQGELGRTPYLDEALKIAMKEAERQFPPPSTGPTFPLKGSMLITESEAEKILQEEKVSTHMEEVGVTLEAVRDALAKSKGRGVQILIDQRAPINTPTEEAERRRHPFYRVDTEMLLRGLLRVPESTGVKILQTLGARPPRDIMTLIYLEKASTLPLTTQEYSLRFTPQAKKAWRLAHAEARRLQDGYVGANHLLLGLVGEGSGIAATLLADMGIDLEKVRAQVKPSYQANDWSVPSNITLQPKLRYIIERASNLARLLHHQTISTGHLLWTLVSGPEDEGLEIYLLKSLGVDFEALRQAVRQALTARVTASEFASESEKFNKRTYIMEAANNENIEEGIYASNATIASVETQLQGWELDKTILAVYPFTLEVRSVLAHAWIAARHRAQRVEPEHILLGLTYGRNGLVGKTLEAVETDFVNRLQTAINNKQDQEEKKPIPVVLTQSTVCKAYLLFAANEAERRDGQGAPIKNEHLLLGLLREEQGTIADLLTSLGTSVQALRTKLLEFMNAV